MAKNAAHKNIEAPATSTISSLEVINYLKQNGKFFINNQELLSEIELPQSIYANVLSVSDFQLKKAQKRNQRLEETNRSLLNTTIQNVKSSAQINNLVLDIVAATTWKDVQNILQGKLKTDFDIDEVKLCLNKNFSKKFGQKTFEANLEELFEDGGKVQLRTIYQTTNTSMYSNNKIASDALLQLNTPAGVNMGFIALGSTSNARFHAGQADDLLIFVANVLSLTMEKLSK